ncbi:ABC transporter ATP-binding protein [Cellulomonas soli]|uniref:ABC transporter n=1 Tax=Cellulomonas soli TaxID=931535 RepID=A0A512PB55_9CELL|nr:ABC transporter ATP-binding protein [Cellulomonas soli]NYI57281.1 ABC-type nitrate/sulfonate/bicarbonate transport system ATPase subunit [Cellulomonas soli]GEP68439.1 ABC transporter [Cellulomonas soli]
MSADPRLHLDDVHVSFPTAGGELSVLDGVSLTVQPGEFVSIIGPSGSGKSTLLHVVGGLVRPGSGSVRLDDQDVTGSRGHISHMPQQPALLPWRSVLENVLLAQEVARTRTPASVEEARDWLDRLGLGSFADAYPHTLSGGMQQRVAFLRALLSPRRFMCLDEPFSALDALTRADMQHWLLRLWEETRRSVLFVTHNIEEALLLSDSVYVLSHRPTRILQKVDVPWPRPRAEDVVDHPDFIRLRRELAALLRPTDAVHPALPAHATSELS